MSTHKTQPPWEFLFSASSFSLQSYELSRLNHAANLRKDIGRLLDQWMEESASALLARWLIEQRERSVQAPAFPPEGTAATQSPGPASNPASDNFLTEFGMRRGPS
ncbi:MAG: hypothetical protein LAN61_09220 [Acidobacteriia bacterium]|nr:hypothetical protein [Terriglobia bacterium]